MPDVPNLPGVPPLTSYSGAGAIDLLSQDVPLAAGLLFGPFWGIFYQGLPVILPASIPGAQSISASIAPFAQVAALLGVPNLLPVFASTIEFDYDQEWTISDYPQEQGGFQSYDRVQLPFDLRVRLGCAGTVAQRQAFLNAIFAIAGASPLGASSLISTLVSSFSSAAGLAGIAGALTGGILTGALAPPRFDIETPEGTYSSCSVRRLAFSRKSYQGATLIQVDLFFVQVRVTSTATFGSTQVPGIAGALAGGQVAPVVPVTSAPLPDVATEVAAAP